MMEPEVIFLGGNFFSLYILLLTVIIHKKFVGIVLHTIGFYVRYSGRKVKIGKRVKRKFPMPE